MIGGLLLIHFILFLVSFLLFVYTCQRIIIDRTDCSLRVILSRIDMLSIIVNQCCLEEVGREDVKFCSNSSMFIS